MFEDVLVVGTDRKRDPDGRKLRAVLQTHFALERAQSFRDLFVHLLAAGSLPLAYLVARAQTAGATLRHIALTGWLTCLGALTIAVLSEARCRSRSAALQKELPPP